ncbi:MAG: hydrolase [Candidatus Marinimicrobia bacterium]|nr:hydrolase [Candidatus Neomarinimicrobiota bacterium]
MLLDRAHSQLLVVDVQERFMPVMYEAELMADRCSILMKAAQQLSIPMTLSEQYKKGLGPTIALLDSIKGESPVMEKAHFSCAADPAICERIKLLATHGRNQLVVCGIESHVCVMQSAIGFMDLNLDVFVVADAISSRHPESVTLAKNRMSNSGVGIVNTEMAVFEWLHIAGTKEFKEISKLIK